MEAADQLLRLKPRKHLKCSNNCISKYRRAPPRARLVFLSAALSPPFDPRPWCLNNPPTSLTSSAWSQNRILSDLFFHGRPMFTRFSSSPRFFTLKNSQLVFDGVQDTASASGLASLPCLCLSCDRVPLSLSQGIFCSNGLQQKSTKTSTILK